MNSILKTMTGLTIGVLCAGAASAATLDPDSFADGTDISTAVSGVTLSAVFAGSGDPATDITSTGAVTAADSSATSTGSRGFAHSGSNTTWGNGSFEYLRVDFASVMSMVSLDFIANDSSDNNAEFLAFDGAGILVDSQIITTNLTAPETLTVTGNISYVFAYWDQPNRFNNGALDNLQYTAAVPLPAALPMLLLGLGALGVARRRREKAV